MRLWAKRVETLDSRGDSTGCTTVRRQNSRMTDTLQVLYVEDNADVRELIVMLLEEEGLAVVACATAEAAEIEFAQRLFDVLITDVSLPSMPGTELATRLQQRNVNLWVVFCSGYAMDQGLASFGPRARSLLKPFESEELHRLMNEIRSTSA